MAAIDLRPVFGAKPDGKVGRRFLLACYYDPNGISTVYEHVRLWQKLSRLRIEVLNFWPASVFELPAGLDLEDYDGVILHPTVGFFPETLEGLDRQLKRGFAQYDGVKVLVKQDEHFRSAAYPRFIRDNGFDVLVTCVPAAELEKVYPRAQVGDIGVVHALTGYVSDYMMSLPRLRRQGERRPVDISYRGSLQPLSFGKLGYEKHQIGDAILAACQGRGLAMDISSRWEDRVFGTAWFDFLARSNAVLGVESGSNLFDFDGSVARWCADYAARDPQADPWSDAYYRQAHEETLGALEGNVQYAQISPRHFEAAATRTVQILYEGEYSGIFLPDRHYLSLKRDLSNLDQVLTFLADEAACTAMTDRAFDEIILNPAYQYAAFVEEADAAIEAALERKGRPSAPARRAASRPRALYLMSHDPVIDPRVAWMGKSLGERFELCEIGMYREGQSRGEASLEQLSPNHTRLRLDPARHDWDWMPNPAEMAGLAPGLQELAMFQLYSAFGHEVLARRLGVIGPLESDLFRFRWFLSHFAGVNAALYQAGRNCGPVELVVATDLDTLPAAIALGHLNGAPVVYDAHEYWPFSRLEFRSWESEFWANIERNLALQASLRVSVAVPLAEHMAREYGADFICVPNATLPVPRPPRPAERLGKGDQVIFLFQGNFSPGRGLEALVKAWTLVGGPSHLALRGPDSPHKDVIRALASSLGLDEDRVSFPPPVEEHRLVNAAAQGDVGVIPYAPSAITYRLCCPNKLSEYMAAGLPILSNDLDYVGAIVRDNDLGEVIDFSNAPALAAAIDALAANTAKRRETGDRARRFFETAFNWEIVSQPLLDRIDALVGPAQNPSAIRLDWVNNAAELRRLASDGLKITVLNPDRPPSSARLLTTLLPADIQTTDFWRGQGANLVTLAQGVRIQCPPIAWHYAACAHLPAADGDTWVELVTTDVVGSVLCGLYDPSSDAITQEQLLPVGPGENSAFFRPEVGRPQMLLFRPGDSDAQGSATFLKAEVWAA